jgi:hypothetical protein
MIAFQETTAAMKFKIIFVWVIESFIKIWCNLPSKYQWSTLISTVQSQMYFYLSRRLLKPSIAVTTFPDTLSVQGIEGVSKKHPADFRPWLTNGTSSFHAAWSAEINKKFNSWVVGTRSCYSSYCKHEAETGSGIFCTLLFINFSTW